MAPTHRQSESDAAKRCSDTGAMSAFSSREINFGGSIAIAVAAEIQARLEVLELLSLS